jgi:RNA polymerase sigma-70 factor (ECF subfamily)
MLAGPNQRQEELLIEKIKVGDRPSFNQLVELYKRQGLGIAYNLVGNLEDAQDVLQEAFCKVYFKIKDFHGQAKFFTWFYRIVVNCSFDLLRKKKENLKLFSQTLVDEQGRTIDVEDIHQQPVKAILDKEREEKLENLIEELPERQKACFLLKYRNDFTSGEIAQILRLSPQTVKVHLFRAVRTLQQKLKAELREKEY